MAGRTDVDAQQWADVSQRMNKQDLIWPLTGSTSTKMMRGLVERQMGRHTKTDEALLQHIAQLVRERDAKTLTQAAARLKNAKGRDIRKKLNELNQQVQDRHEAVRAQMPTRVITYQCNKREIEQLAIGVVPRPLSQAVRNDPAWGNADTNFRVEILINKAKELYPVVRDRAKVTETKPRDGESPLEFLPRFRQISDLHSGIQADQAAVPLAAHSLAAWPDELVDKLKSHTPDWQNKTVAKLCTLLTHFQRAATASLMYTAKLYCNIKLCIRAIAHSVEQVRTRIVKSKQK